MYLGLLNVEGAHGRTLPLASCLLLEQDAASFQWFFDGIAHVRDGEPVGVVMTDQDPAIAKGLRDSRLAAALHLLCIWHVIAKNLPANMKRYSKGALVYA